MITVFKYPLSLVDVQYFDMPDGAKVLSVALQLGTICLWARVDSDAPLELRGFRVAGTGHELAPDVGRHLGTVLLNDDALVFHVFEIVTGDTQ